MIVCLFLDTDDHSRFSDAARGLIREVSEAAEPDIRALLPGLPEEIELASQTGDSVIPELGGDGTAWNPHRVNWTVDPSRPGGIEAIAATLLRPLLFHEIHHLARGWVIFPRLPRERFIDSVVHEGLATAFARDFSGAHEPLNKLFAEYPTDVEEWVRELLDLPLSAPYDDWMELHPDGRRYIGYRAGTYISDRAIAASGRSAADLVLTPVRDILNLAGIES
jgi:hypothetical protein